MKREKTKDGIQSATEKDAFVDGCEHREVSEQSSAMLR
jgi:hypothetical protein